MKKVISIITLAFFSTSLFAARLPTSKEGIDIYNRLKNNSSIIDIISIVKNDKLDLVAVFPVNNSNGQMIKRSGVSVFAGDLISLRLNSNNPVGNLQENLHLLDLLIDQGVNVNIKQTGDGYGGTDFWNGNATLVTMAADACSLETIKLLERKGADLGAETFNWARALHQATQRSEDTDQPCKDVAEYLINKARVSDFYTLKSLFFTNDTREKFIQGNYIDQSLTDYLKTKIRETLSVSFSKRPEGDEPSDEWVNDFLERISMPTTEQKDWWATQDEGHKAWACYYSTFDEAVAGFNTIGMTKEWLRTNSIGGIYTFGSFSNFMVYDFTDYCNSIK